MSNLYSHTLPLHSQYTTQVRNFLIEFWIIYFSWTIMKIEGFFTEKKDYHTDSFGRLNKYCTVQVGMSFIIYIRMELDSDNGSTFEWHFTTLRISNRARVLVCIVKNTSLVHQMFLFGNWDNTEFLQIPEITVNNW